MAFTPWISFQRALIPKGFDSYDVGFKGANSTSKLLPLNPAQSSEAHSLVMASCVRLFLLCATSELAPVLCSVDHFEHSVLRLVELVGRHCPPMREADISLATFATEALGAIGSADSRACALINGATHPFGSGKDIRSYVRGERGFQSVSFSARRWPAFARYHSNGCRLPVEFLQMPHGVLVLASCHALVFGSLVRTLRRAALRILADSDANCRELLEHAKHDINLPPRALSILCFACSSSCCPLGFMFAVCSLLNSSW